jgi:hypothetical protein
VVLVYIEVVHGFLQVPHATVNHLGGGCRTARSEVAGFDDDGFETSQLRVERTARSRSATSDDADIEFLIRDLIQSLLAVSHVNTLSF